MARYTYGLIGRPLAHSFSPGYFRAFFEREGIDASYELYELERIEELPQLLEAHSDLRGLNVTLPYKREVLRYASECSDEVKLLGAANVLSVRRTPEGKPILKAHNTDVEGFRRSLAQLLRGEHPEAWVFGTGGAASAVLRGDLLPSGEPYATLGADELRGLDSRGGSADKALDQCYPRGPSAGGGASLALRSARSGTYMLRSHLQPFAYDLPKPSLRAGCTDEGRARDATYPSR